MPSHAYSSPLPASTGLLASGLVVEAEAMVQQPPKPAPTVKEIAEQPPPICSLRHLDDCPASESYDCTWQIKCAVHHIRPER